MTVPRWLCRAATVTTVLGVMAAIAAIGYSSATAAAAPPQPCPPAQQAATCIKGQVIIWEDPANPKLNQFTQEDNSAAPQFWVGVGGSASGANPFCVTDRSVVRFVACLGGTWGNGRGEPVLLLYQVAGGRVTGTARLDYEQLAWLDRWLARRGVR